jgi:hypothetical protein
MIKPLSKDLRKKVFDLLQQKISSNKKTEMLKVCLKVIHNTQK